MTTAKALAQMRGHARLWRDDLVDGITGAVVKDDLDEDHPLLRVVLTSLRGDRIGRLAEGADVPPLVQEVRRRWADQELPFSRTVSPLTLALDHAADRATSQLLHGLRVVGVPAAVPPAAPTGPLTARARIDGSERWALVWNQDVETALIHASRWGGSLEQAVTAVLEHRARLGTATTLAAVLTDAVRAGLEDVSGRLGAALRDVLARSDDLGELGVVLESLVRLVHFDTWLGAVGRSDLADLTRFAHERTTSVLERLAPVAEGPHIPAAVAALRTLAETTATLASALDLDADAVAGALERQTERPPGSPGARCRVRGRADRRGLAAVGRSRRRAGGADGRPGPNRALLLGVAGGRWAPGDRRTADLHRRGRRPALLGRRCLPDGVARPAPGHARAVEPGARLAAGSPDRGRRRPRPLDRGRHRLGRPESA
jgi:hypothetical protein